MHDTIQRAIESAASQNAVTRAIAVACAVWLVYALGAVWLGTAAWRRHRLSAAVIARIVVVVALAFVLSRVLGHLIVDTRPYIVDHTKPLAPVSRDNGFPSDHVLMAAALTAALWWIDRRLMAAFAVGTLLVMLGRMGIGAHHTLDVLGSVGIVAIATFVALALPLPAAWRRPLWEQRGAETLPFQPRS